MARYIDADSLYRRVKTHTNPYGKPTLDYKSGVKVIEMINQEPTADVVPKSEVEKIFEEIEELAKIYTFPVVKNGVVEIAKEPFWCIEPNDLAELKNKYTEETE